MAALTSYNQTIAEKKCQYNTLGGYNQPMCNLIWNNFRDYGYRTAYAEDVPLISTFNFGRSGFAEQPTDYYLRPFTICIENNMRVENIDDLPNCIGRKHYAEYIIDYALQFSITYSDEPIFGLFWMNSFSHNSFDMPAAMDMKILEYLERMKDEKILQRTIVFLFADHGMRFGPLLKLKSGFLEERLPMMFISLPQWYRNEHPEFVKALQVNKNRLTSPFDIYATLKDILEMTNPVKEFPYLNDTTQGISIFREIPENRTCLNAGIGDHWCTCLLYEIVSINDKEVKSVAHLLIDEMNKYLVGKKIETKCAVLELNNIYQALRKTGINVNKSNNELTYRLWYFVRPRFKDFQATVLFNKTANKIEINVEDISRLDSYEQTAACIDMKEAKKYCICRK